LAAGIRVPSAVDLASDVAEVVSTGSRRPGDGRDHRDRDRRRVHASGVTESLSSRQHTKAMLMDIKHVLSSTPDLATP